MQNTSMNLKMLFGHLGHGEGELLGIWSLICGIRTIGVSDLKKTTNPSDLELSKIKFSSYFI